MGLPDKIEEKSYLSDKVIVNEVLKGADLPYNRLSYLHKDRLGSIVSVTNDQGIETEWHAFDAFGSPKQGNLSSSGGLLRTTNTVYGLDISDEEYATNRGFTGHEHLDDVKLIHMNGRVYDPGMGRFLSVDPIIQSPGNSQSLNPYTYLMNNPLAGTDPTGYTACGGGPQSCVGEFFPSNQFASNEGKSGNAPRGSICVTNSLCKVVDYRKLQKEGAVQDQKDTEATGGQAKREQQSSTPTNETVVIDDATFKNATEILKTEGLKKLTAAGIDLKNLSNLELSRLSKRLGLKPDQKLEIEEVGLMIEEAKEALEKTSYIRVTRESLLKEKPSMFNEENVDRQLEVLINGDPTTNTDPTNAFVYPGDSSKTFIVPENFFKNTRSLGDKVMTIIHEPLHQAGGVHPRVNPRAFDHFTNPYKLAPYIFFRQNKE